MYVTDHHDMNLAVKVALNPNTTNQQIQHAGMDGEWVFVLPIHAIYK